MPSLPPPIDQSLRLAYEQTDYCLPALGLVVHIGSPCDALDLWLMERGFGGGAFVTAYNPASRLRSEAENAHWQSVLEAELQGEHQLYLTAIHRDPSGKWPDERSCFVLGIEAASAIELGRRYGQNAIVIYTSGRGAQLEWC